MKILGSILLAAALLIGCSPARAVECNQAAVYDTNTSGSTVLVTAATARTIYVCGLHIMWGGTATVGLVKGTGTACATNEAKVTPAYSGVAQSVLTDSSPLYRGIRVDPGADLCIKTSAGVAIQALVLYAQR